MKAERQLLLPCTDLYCSQLISFPYIDSVFPVMDLLDFLQLSGESVVVLERCTSVPSLLTSEPV